MRIRPDRPVCWESADTLRVGFERPDARVDAPSAGVQRLIGALQRGVHSSAIAAEVRRAGATPQEARALLDSLAPVLITEDGANGTASITPRVLGHEPAVTVSEARPLIVHIADDDRPVPGLWAALDQASSGVPLRHSQDGTSADLVVQVERFLEPLERAQRWLVEGRPHLLIGFTDRHIRVGPLVVGDGAPCHTCASLAALAQDPSLSIVAAQLAGTSAPTESSSGVHIAATWAAVMIRNWLSGDVRVHSTRTSFEVSLGQVVSVEPTEHLRPHPDCACATVNSRFPLPR